MVFLSPLKSNCFQLLLLIACPIFLLGCGSSQPTKIPTELEAYVMEPIIAPFSLRPSSPYAANLASGKTPLTAKQHDELLAKLAAFGDVGQLVINHEGGTLDSLLPFKKLEGLHISFTREAMEKKIDLRQLGQLKQLKELSVGYRGGVFLQEAMIEVPPSLVHLTLQNLPVRTIPGLDSCKDLRELDISFIPSLEGVDVLKKLPTLKRLRINQGTLRLLSEKNIVMKSEVAEVTESESFSGTTMEAGEVAVYGADRLKSLDGIETWRGVKKITFSFINRFEDVSALSKLKSLQEIRFIQCGFRGKPLAVDDLKDVQKELADCAIFVQ